MNKVILNNCLPFFWTHQKDTSVVSFFLIVKAGSNYEEGYPAGIAHFLEHLFFKGNKTYSKKDVAHYFEYIGGGLHASTSKELVSFELITPITYFDKALEMMVSLLREPNFLLNDIEEERRVIAQEIALYEDSPEDVLLDWLEYEVWKGSSLANPILGTRESLEKINVENISMYYENFFAGNNMSLSCCGNLSEERIEKIKTAFEKFPKGETKNYCVSLPNLGRNYYIKKDFAQSYFAYVYKAFGKNDEKHWYEYLLCDYVGSGMTSLLYQRLREELQLIYDVSMYYDGYPNNGILVIQIGADKMQKEKILEEMNNLHEHLSKLDLDEESFMYLKEKVKNQFIIDYTSPCAKLLFTSRNELVNQTTYTLEDIIFQIDQLNVTTFNQVVQKRFQELSYSSFSFI